MNERGREEKTKFIMQTLNELELFECKRYVLFFFVVVIVYCSKKTLLRIWIELKLN